MKEEVVESAPPTPGKKRPLMTTALVSTKTSSTPRKKLSRKKQLQILQRRVYDMEGLLAKAKRNFTTLLPWEEIAQALKDDTIEQVMDNRSLKQQVETQKRMVEILHSWVQSMSPLQRTPNPFEETWRNSHLLKGDDASRRVAQTWIVQQAYHNTQRALAPVSFPDSMETFIDVVACPQDDQFELCCMAQTVVPFAFDHVSEIFWVVENTFTTKTDLRVPTIEDIHRLTSEDVRYGHEKEDIHGRTFPRATPLPHDSPPVGPQTIRKNALHGQIRERDRTTVICRTILHDEASPLEHSGDWAVDIKQWTVMERVGPMSTRVRTFYTIGHPLCADGTPVAMEDLARAFRVPCDGSFQWRQREYFTRIHRRQREMFFSHLDKVLRLTATP
ncbi:Aste57867_18458 [Aphanomyces stellatus]|uniref:Aste57867_18458 protein n=1 Tax=Aphanomyces stellatus TaxID=120398 RepID=A0A485LAH0_9STRA|nr:hypothetical protein As57867_018396 [Aphanomyces stellatus]VFT95194.1 Aste57867_18458 [Aphanomyces stellatus]